MSLITDIAKWTDLVQSWAAKTSDVFYSNVAQDVTIKVIDDLGDVVDITIPNNKKMQDTFEDWRATLNIKNVNGVVVDDTLNPLSVDKFGGLTLAEYDALYTSYFDARGFKLLGDVGSGTQAANYFMIAVTKENEVYGWGYNNASILSVGLGTNPSQLINLQQPTSKNGSNIIKCWAIGSHMGILYEDGDLYLRGIQGHGHFGIGNTSAQTQWVLSANNVKDYRSCSTGDQDESPMAMIVKTDGSVYTAGDNGHGELGIGSVTNTYVWTKIYDAPSNANDKAINLMINGADAAHSAFITETGRLFVSGYNGYGQLGTGNTTNVNTSTEVTPNWNGNKPIKIIGNGYYDAGYYGASFVLTDAGTVYSTGYNGQGQGANGTTTNKSSFSEVIYETTHDIVADPVIDIHTTQLSLYLLTQSGNVYSIGYNNFGQLGNSNVVNQTSFTLVETNTKSFYGLVPSDASQHSHCIAIKNDNTMTAWGHNAYGCLGLGHASNIATPTEILFNRAQISPIKQVASSGYSTSKTLYYLLESGEIHAAGYNGFGQTSIYSTASYHSNVTRVI